jgi:hypothetical protein
MSLILSSFANYWPYRPLPEATEIGLLDTSSRMSRSYNLSSIMRISGKLIKIEPLETDAEKEAFRSIKELTLEFIPQHVTSTNTDMLYFTYDSWRPIANAGFVELERYIFTVKLDELKYPDGEVVKVFPLRDVTS